MSKIILIFVATLFGACALVPVPKSRAEKRAEQTALDRAHRIVAKRGWPLPAGYRAQVETFHYIPEMAASYDEYWVVFDLPRAHRSAAPLYRITFLKTTGEFTGAYDDRRNVQDEEVEVAKRAFEKRFPGERYTTLAGPEGRIVRVTFLADKVPYRPGHILPMHTVVAIVDRATLTVKSLKEVNE